VAEPVAIRADLLDTPDDPGWSVEPFEVDVPRTGHGVRWRPDHWLLIDGGRIVGAQTDDPAPAFERIDRRGCLLTPGLVDMHVHMPQLSVMASHGTGLLEWLERYTFPAEQAYADPAVCHSGAKAFVDALLAHGTTSAMVFPTVHPASAHALFEACAARGMRVVAGQCLMDRDAPTGLTVDAARAEAHSRELIDAWHDRGRARYAATVRFAPTSTPDQLERTGRLLRERPDLAMQTHLAETRDELALVARTFPEARSYLDVYAQAGLVTPRSVFAHGIWLDDRDREVLALAGASVAHCPSSNLFLGSGLMDWQALERAGVRVVLASDVGGGTSLSMLRTMADAYRVQSLLDRRLTAFKALHACTRAAAQSLRLDAEIGTLEVGRAADLALWRWAVGPVANARDARARDLHERLFAWMMLGDERNLVATWVAGKPMHGD
jgi:guanine deaminase